MQLKRALGLKGAKAHRNMCLAAKTYREDRAGNKPDAMACALLLPHQKPR